MINEQIRDREVRLIGADGEQLGIVSSREAQKIADEAGLDLVKIAPNAKPPVCKVIDYGKYRYEQARKEKDAKKKQKTVELKEIRLSPNIEANDLPHSGLKSLSRCAEKMLLRNWLTAVQCLPVRLPNSAKRTRLQREQSSVFNAHANPTV